MFPTKKNFLVIAQKMREVRWVLGGGGRAVPPPTNPNRDFKGLRDEAVNDHLVKKIRFFFFLFLLHFLSEFKENFYFLQKNYVKNAIF